MEKKKIYAQRSIVTQSHVKCSIAYAMSIVICDKQNSLFPRGKVKFLSLLEAQGLQQGITNYLSLGLFFRRSTVFASASVHFGYSPSQFGQRQIIYARKMGFKRNFSPTPREVAKFRIQNVWIYSSFLLPLELP